jgi:hypothetical protein
MLLAKRQSPPFGIQFYRLSVSTLHAAVKLVRFDPLDVDQNDSVWCA